MGMVQIVAGHPSPIRVGRGNGPTPLILAPIIVFEPDGCFGIHDVIDPEGLADLGNVETLLRLVVVIESGDGPVDITGKREKVEVILTAQIDPAGGNDVAGERRLVV